MFDRPGVAMKKGKGQIVAGLCLAALLALAGCDASQSHSLSLMNEGVRAYKEGSYGSAVERLREAIDKWPDNAQAHYLLGQIYLHKYQEPDKAATHFGHATRLDPSMTDYWYQHGAALTEIKRDDEARASLLKALELKKDHGEAHYRLGILAERAGDPKQAAAHYGDSVQANPRIPWAYYNLGDLYIRNNKFHEALQVFENGTGNNPEHAEMFHGLGVAQLSLGRPDDARRALETAISFKKPYPSASYNLSLAFRGLKDPRAEGTHLENFLKEARGGKENNARIAAAEARLLEIVEDERKNNGPSP
jgi:tetratricopeptide (TPR) repeat protein